MSFFIAAMAFVTDGDRPCSRNGQRSQGRTTKKIRQKERRPEKEGA
jgi:hypothetical protein